MGWVVFGFVAIVVIAFIVAAVKSSQAKDKLSEILSRHPGAKAFVSDKDFTYVAVDFEKERIVLGCSAHQFSPPRPPYEKDYPFSAIVKVDLVSNGATLTSTNRGSQAMGAAVGALAFGGVGAVIGGLSGSSTSVDRVRRLTIKVQVDDREMPVHEVTFYKDGSNKGSKSDGILVTPARKAADEMVAHVVNAIRIADRTIIHAPAAELVPAATPTVARIREFWDLKEMGAITSEELEAEKRKILASAPAEASHGTALPSPS